MFGLVRHDNQGCKNQDKHVDDGASEIIVASLRFLFLLLFVKREYVLRYKASMLTIPVGKGTKTNLNCTSRLGTWVTRSNICVAFVLTQRSAIISTAKRCS